jgi:hypothetical protein
MYISNFMRVTPSELSEHHSDFSQDMTVYTQVKARPPSRAPLLRSS